MIPTKKRWLYIIVIAAAAVIVFLLATAMGAEPRGGKDIPPVEETGFSLNGEDYPLAPVMQDFIDRGWTQDRAVEWIGRYTEETGVSDLVSAGYRLTRGNDSVTVYLDIDSRRDGVEPERCRLRSLRLSGDNLDSFCIDGKELSGADGEEIAGLLGNPSYVRREKYGEFYYYFMPERGMPEIKFTFPYKQDAVSQIFIIFVSEISWTYGSSPDR